MHFGQVFREGQAEAGAAVGAEGVVPHLAEGLQDLWNILGSDADPCIRYSEGNAARIYFLQLTVIVPPMGVKRTVLDSRLIRIYRVSALIRTRSGVTSLTNIWSLASV